MKLNDDLAETWEYTAKDRRAIRENFRSVERSYNTLQEDQRKLKESQDELREFLNFCVARDPKIFSEFKRYMEAREKVEGAAEDA